MNLTIYDPIDPTTSKHIHTGRHQYLTDMFFCQMEKYGSRNSIPINFIKEDGKLGTIKDSSVLLLADYLNLDTVNILKNNNCKIIGFSVTDSSYISQSCREASVLSKIDLMFMLAGIQTVNTGHEFVVDKNFNIVLEKRRFLPEEDWTAFNMMRMSGRLKSLPYVHWERQPHVEAKPYNLRSQKALIRGGHHMRRFILALKLMEIDRLDINSGFVTSPYFQDDMNPQFRYCDECRAIWKHHRLYPAGYAMSKNCTNPHGLTLDASNLGEWNNRCPQSFYAISEKFGGRLAGVEKLMNARWLTQEDHLKMLARITFTSDCKWLFSIYAAQRFWDAAMVGCINVLPRRTTDQDYFPAMNHMEHYLTFNEDMTGLDLEFSIEEGFYNDIARNAKALYDQWLHPTDYAINTNLLKHIFDSIEAIQ